MVLGVFLTLEFLSSPCLLALGFKHCFCVFKFLFNLVGFEITVAEAIFLLYRIAMVLFESVLKTLLLLLKTLPVVLKFLMLRLLLIVELLKGALVLILLAQL